MLSSVDVVREGLRRYLEEHAPMSVAQLARKIDVVDQSLSRFVAPGSTNIPRGENWTKISDWALANRIINRENAQAAVDNLLESGQTAGPLALYRLGQISGQVAAVRNMLASALEEQNRVLRAIEAATAEVMAIDPPDDDEDATTPADAADGALASSAKAVLAETKASPVVAPRPRQKPA